MPTTCPSHQELLRFYRGMLDERQLLELGRHLEVCDDCLSNLGSVKEDNDTFGSALQSAHASTVCDFTKEPGFREFDQYVKQLTDTNIANEHLTEPGEPVRIPKRIGRHPVLGRLGAGGMGTVYDALHGRTGQPVAIKVLAAARVLDSQVVARFHREILAIGTLDHPRIVRALEASHDDGTPFLVMERIDGMDLSRLMKFCGRLPISDACEIARQAAEGLTYIHAQGWVHRDVKPSNLMLTSGGEVKILDLGLARLQDSRLSGGEMTSTGHLLGTVDYMAPEQTGGSRSIDIRADVYGLGATLYKLLTALPPYGSGKSTQLLQRLRQMALTDPNRIETYRAEIPPPLGDVIHQMLERDPDERIQQPQDIVAALEPFCDGQDVKRLITETLEKHPLSLTRTQEHPPRSRTTRRVWLASSLAVASIAGAVAISSRMNEPGSTKATRSAPSPSNRIPTLSADVAVTRVLTGHTDCIFDLAFIDDETVVSASWDGTVRLWNVHTGNEVRRMQANTQVLILCFAVSPDRNVIAAGTSGGVVYLWKTTTGQLLGTVSSQSEHGPPASMAFSPDGSKLLYVSVIGQSEMFDLATQRSVGTIDSVSAGEKKKSSYRAMFLDTDRVLIGGGGDLTVFDVASGSALLRFDSPPPLVDAMALISDGRIAIASHQRQTLDVWRLSDGKRIERQPWHGHIFDLASFPKPDMIATARSDHSVGVWDMQLGKQTLCLQGDGSYTQRIAISLDGHTIVSGGGWHIEDKLIHDGDYGLRVWKVPEEYRAEIEILKKLK